MQCPFKMKGRYVLKIKEEKSPQAQRGTDIHKSFEEAILNGTPLPDEFDFYSDYVELLRGTGAQPELKVGVDRDWQPVPFDSEDAWIISVLDLWLVRGNVAHGWDWKTGKIYPDHLKQKEFYTAMMFNTLPPEVERVTFTNVYMDLKKAVPDTFERKDIPNLQERWGNRIRVMERDTDCVPTPSFSCNYCAVSKRKGGPCPF